MKKNKYIPLVLLLSLSPAIVLAALSEDLKKLNKCYAIFVGERIKTTDPLWKAVESGKKTGTDACMAIFDRGALDASGSVTKADPDDPSNIVGSKVLTNFLRFQQSQFKVPDVLPILASSELFTRDVIDLNEPAYHVLYSIFAPNQKYSDVVKRTYGLRAIRSSGASRSLSINGDELPDFRQNNPGGGLRAFNPTFVPTGRFMGISKNNISNVIIEGPVLANYELNNFNVNRHMGAGAIGSQPYLSANVGQDEFSDGGNKMFRRWSKNMLDDFLCRDMPALRSVDVVNEVQTNSNIVFKNGISCMACHSAMDPLAATIRNGFIGYSFYEDHPSKLRFYSETNVTAGFANMPTINRDGNFHARPPNGRLFYRSYDGSIVKEEVVGIQQLGEKIAATNDLYVCAAKRYYRFMTGISVDLSDIGSLGTRVFTKGESFQRNKVIQMGLDLKQHQSIRSLIKNILDQKAFLYPDQGV